MGRVTPTVMAAERSRARPVRFCWAASWENKAPIGADGAARAADDAGTYRSVGKVFGLTAWK